ncbi:MAG TPA: BrnT family toxin [Pirellulaceae bacterium]|jgi:hypothetical protein
MEFEWDEAKASANEQKHGVDFPEAMTVFADSLALTGYDLDHSDDKAATSRWVTQKMDASYLFVTPIAATWFA